MNIIKNIIQKEPDKVNRGSFLELAKKEGNTTVSTGIHQVKLLRGETGTKNNFMTGKPEEGIDLYFEEDGVEKKYFIPTYVNDKNSDKFGKFHYLFERFADIPEGSFLEMEYIKKGKSGFIDVRTGNPGLPTISVDGVNEIPVVEDDEIDVKDIPFGFSNGNH